MPRARLKFSGGLEAVLCHEVAHILIARAADGRAVPRWFNEGLAVVAERAWHFEDRWQLASALVSAAFTARPRRPG
jgi:hypothetical protein